MSGSGVRAEIRAAPSPHVANLAVELAPNFAMDLAANLAMDLAANLAMDLTAGPFRPIG
ncbi:hypothetical protein [Streptomyces sp. NPDC052179]|uniref:hypothetical protein n=1 Tax=Streptomyces sp. NPDC052179 TaxID=3155680 RepID=UPI003420A6C1